MTLRQVLGFRDLTLIISAQKRVETTGVSTCFVINPQNHIANPLGLC